MVRGKFKRDTNGVPIMNIITCYKVVPEDQDITINADRTLGLDKAEPKISQYDLNAVEAGVQLKEQAADSTVVALSVGAGRYLENSKVRKDILSRGPDSLILVVDDGYERLLPAETARVLAAAARKMDFDLIICGEGSGDIYAQQVGTLLGERLGLPNINAVSKVTLGDKAIVVERSLDDEVETLELPLPAVISVSADINTPRIPSMKAILGAGKKPVVTLSPADAGDSAADPAAVMVSVLAPEQSNRKKVIIEGDADDNIKAFVENIRRALN